MTGSGQLVAAGIALERAEGSDIEGLLVLQRAAYALNRTLLGVEPLPLLADYALLLCEKEVWVLRRDGGLAAALILEPRTDHLLLWSIATDPTVQHGGLGRAMLEATEVRARQVGAPAVRLYTGSTLRHLIDWYTRHGYAIERSETLSDRSITHMIKHLKPEAAS